MCNIITENDMFASHPWIRNTANELKVPLDILILKLMKAYMRSFALCKAALRALSKTLTVDELFYPKEQKRTHLKFAGFTKQKRIHKYGKYQRGLDEPCYRFHEGGTCP